MAGPEGRGVWGGGSFSKHPNGTTLGGPPEGPQWNLHPRGSGGRGCFLFQGRGLQGRPRRMGPRAGGGGASVSHFHPAGGAPREKKRARSRGRQRGPPRGGKGQGHSVFPKHPPGTGPPCSAPRGSGRSRGGGGAQANGNGGRRRLRKKGERISLSHRSKDFSFQGPIGGGVWTGFRWGGPEAGSKPQGSRFRPILAVPAQGVAARKPAKT